MFAWTNAALVDQVAIETPSSVAFSNFTPGTLDAWGLGYEALAARNPRLVYATGSTFGPEGPDAEQRGADLAGQAAGGLIARTGPSATGAGITTIPNYELWVKNVNEAGGLTMPDGSQRMIEVVEYDNRSSNQDLVRSIERLASQDKVDLILIGHQPRGQDGRYLFFLPLDPIEPKLQYTLLTADPNPTEVRLADITPVAFTRGTLITLADGSQRAIENLAPGDKILTRDHGPQPVRWVGHRTVRAVGAHAPVVIPKGVLANESDLIVSQHQRLFIYRQGRRGLGETAEILVKARDLVDDDQVYIRGGGFVEYFHVVFDRHEIIYAEYIPTESLLINDASLGQLPEDMAREVTQTLPDTAHDPHYGTEADPDMLARLSPQDLRRRD